MKLPGAKDVRIEAGDTPSTQKVIVVADKEGITKEDAVKSLGEHAKRYVVQTWTAPVADAAEGGEGGEGGEEKKKE